MFFKCQLIHALTALLITLLCQEILAEVASNNNAISNLYDNLLQREYAGPVVFPNHQVERKAVRSPSLRLRFGRRSDPDLMPNAEKRGWFGDVNQKPIRSPSLRLRFGRRSDPTMPMHNDFDTYMNNLAALEDNDDYNDAYELYQRAVRKPQARLRFGRSVAFEDGNNEVADLDNSQEQAYTHSGELINTLMNSEKLRNMLLTLRRLDAEITALAAAENAAENTNVDDEFLREARKPAPLRLRFGRSTGMQQNTAAAAAAAVGGGTAGITAAVQPKKTVAQNIVAKSEQQQSFTGQQKN